MRESSAYDIIAPDYDCQLAGDAWMRHILWKRYLEAFKPGDHVLDVGCGTGTDAVFLARRGIRITGIDISPAMIAQAARKMAVAGLSRSIELAVLDIGQLSSLPAQTFDGIISSFAALNTLPALAPFAADAARLLLPGGRVILHMLSGSSLWEWALLLAHGDWVDARQLRTYRQRIFRVGGQPVQHYLPRAEEAYSCYFASHFQLRGLSGLGITRPPSSARPLPKPMLTALGRLDEFLGSYPPFVNWGRFVVLDMVRNSSADYGGKGNE